MTNQSLRTVGHPLRTQLLIDSGVKNVADARALLKQARKRLKEMARVEAAGKLVLPSHRAYLKQQVHDCEQMIRDGEEEERGCLGKERYPSQAAADGALKFFRGEPGERGAGALQSYACRFCGAWHLGHPGPMSREERAREARAQKGAAA